MKLSGLDVMLLTCGELAGGTFAPPGQFPQTPDRESMEKQHKHSCMRACILQFISAFRTQKKTHTTQIHHRNPPTEHV